MCDTELPILFLCSSCYRIGFQYSLVIPNLACRWKQDRFTVFRTGDCAGTKSLQRIKSMRQDPKIPFLVNPGNFLDVRVSDKKTWGHAYEAMWKNPSFKGLNQETSKLCFDDKLKKDPLVFYTHPASRFLRCFVRFLILKNFMDYPLFLESYIFIKIWINEQIVTIFFIEK